MSGQAPAHSPARPPIGVLIVEDHPATRQGLRLAIECQPDLRVVGEAESCHEARARVQELAPDVVLLDLDLPDGNGWNLLEEWRRLDILPPTLVLSGFDETLFARRLLEAGARGYLVKHEPIGVVLAAIREIHAGRLVASPTLRSQLMQEALHPAQPLEATLAPGAANTLSDRELQVFALLARNRSNREISLQLRVSEKSVHTYKTRLMQKLGIQTTPELAARFAACQAPAWGLAPPVPPPSTPPLTTDTNPST
jgi:DNA-binding NarL/FixJ family response regulator